MVHRQNTLQNNQAEQSLKGVISGKNLLNLTQSAAARQSRDSNIIIVNPRQISVQK